jgi:hypothetical protein
VPNWQAEIGENACNSFAKILDPAQIQFNWDVNGQTLGEGNATKSNIVHRKPVHRECFRC